MATATPTELTEKQWELIAPLLPKRAWTGRPRAEDRKTINGILWVLRTGARWADMPRKYGAPSTAHVRLQTWQKEGVWESIWRTLLSNLDEKGKLDGRKLILMALSLPPKRGRSRRDNRQRQRKQVNGSGRWKRHSDRVIGSQCQSI